MPDEGIFHNLLVAALHVLPFLVVVVLLILLFPVVFHTLLFLSAALLIQLFLVVALPAEEGLGNCTNLPLRLCWERGKEQVGHVWL